MSDFSIKVEKITGRASTLAGCGVFTKRITLANGIVGTLVSCILISSTDDFDVGDVMSALFEIVQKKLEDGDEGILSALKAAVETSKTYNPSLDINFVHAFFVQNACYVVRLGDKVSVLVFDPPNSASIDFESGSGPVSPGQIYLIATAAFLSIFDVWDFTKEADVDFSEVIDGIAGEIAEEEDQSKIGAAFVVTSPRTENVAGQAEDVEEKHEGTEEEVPKEEGIEGTEEIEATEEVAPEDTEDKSGEPVDQIKSDETVSESPIHRITEKIGQEFNRIRHGDISAVRRNLATVAIIVILVLVTLVGFAVYKNSQNSALLAFNEHYTAASSKYSEAVAIMDLNKSRSREILVDAEREIKLALEIRPKDEKGKKLYDDIIAKLKQTDVFANVDFSEVADVGDKLESLGISGKNLIGISGSKLYQVNPATDDVDKRSFSVKKVDVAGGVTSGFFFDKFAFVISGEKILREEFVGGKSVDVGEKSQGLDIFVFAGNVYVLSSSSITKFVPIESGYSSGSEYLNASETFSPKSHFATDGSVWVSAGDKILKFTRGEKEDFEISGLVGQLGELSLIYTSSDLDNLYVVDSTNSALLVISKDGVYQKALQSPEFSKASDLVVDDSEETLYVAVGSKILKAGL